MTHNFPPLARAPTYQRIYDAIEKDIVSGKLEDGSKLPTETELATQFAVHRSTVREGMRLLEEAGLISRGAAKRMIVTVPKTADAARRASKGLALHGVTFFEVWEALLLFQPEAARLAATKAATRTQAKLEQICVATQNASSLIHIVEGAVAFFEEVAALADNRVVRVSLQSLNILLAPSLMKVIRQLPNAQSRIVDAQKNITQALDQGDADKAAAWMRRHVEDLRRGYELVGQDIAGKVL